MLAGVNLLGRKKDNPPPDDAEAADDVEATADSDSGTKASRATAPKGRPTPKRDSSRRRGPIAPAPMTTAEARRRRKELRGPKLSRDERREDKVAKRAAMIHGGYVWVTSDQDEGTTFYAAIPAQARKRDSQ